jgi:CheY-like chemotaxis protein
MPQKLLLADDSVTIQRVIELTFADEDVQLTAVGNGKLAIERIEADPPDIVLADVGMPEKDGYEVAAFVKSTPHLAHIPVLLLTGAFEPVDEERAREAGCDGVLAKPFEPQMVITRVKELLADAARPMAGLRGGQAFVPPADAADAAATPDADGPLQFRRRQTMAMPEYGVPPADAVVPEGAFASMEGLGLWPAPSADGPAIPAPVMPPAGSDETSLEPFDLSWAPASPEQQEPLPATGSWAPRPPEVQEALPSTGSWAPPSPDALVASVPFELPVEPPAPAPVPVIEPVVPAPVVDSFVAAPFVAAPLVNVPPLAVDPETEPFAREAFVPAAAEVPQSAAATETPSVFADAFSALLAAESGSADAGSPFFPMGFGAPMASAGPDAEDLVERVTQQVLARLTDRVIRESVADIVSKVAERLVREEIERLKASVK